MVLGTVWVTLAASLADNIDLFVDCFSLFFHLLIKFMMLELFYISGLIQELCLYFYSQTK